MADSDTSTGFCLSQVWWQEEGIQEGTSLEEVLLWVSHEKSLALGIKKKQAKRCFCGFSQARLKPTQETLDL